MKVFVQWAIYPVENWEEIDSSQWASTPTRPEPTNLNVIDTTKGWVQALNIQGINFSGKDHYAVEDITDGVRVTIWNDDNDDWPNDYAAWVWDLLEPAYDANVNAVNTRQSFTAYFKDQKRIPIAESIDICTSAHRWNQFSSPAEAITRHGIWVPDVQNVELLAIQSKHGWREWHG